MKTSKPRYMPVLVYHVSCIRDTKTLPQSERWPVQKKSNHHVSDQTRELTCQPETIPADVIVIPRKELSDGPVLLRTEVERIFWIGLFCKLIIPSPLNWILQAANASSLRSYMFSFATFLGRFFSPETYLFFFSEGQNPFFRMYG